MATEMTTHDTADISTKLNLPPSSTEMNETRSEKAEIAECRDATEERPAVVEQTTEAPSDSSENAIIANGESGESAETNDANKVSNSSDEVETTPLSGIDYSGLEETPYEHGFEPGDHIIRWDMLPILWPIQIHGIVLEVSDDKTTVTICDFGITTAKDDEKTKTSKNVEKMVADDDAKFKEAIQDMPVDGEATDEEGAKKKDKKRLNIITLTKWSDLRKWHKVNYDGGLIKGVGGVGKSLKGLGEKTEKFWTSTKQLFVKKESSEFDDMLDDDDVDSLDELTDVQNQIVNAVIRKDSKGSGVKASVGSQKITSSPSEKSADSAKEIAKEKMLNEFLTGNSEVDSDTELMDPKELEITTNEVAKEDFDEPKTLAQMVAAANEVDKQSPRKILIKSTPQPPANDISAEKQQSWRGSFMKSLSNIFPQKSNSKPLEGDESKPADTVKKEAPNLPRSDPTVLVLARTRFLLEQGEDFLPPYHIVNSNSECIAVWCKTGRWSTLQASVFLHSTAIGNTKSTTAISLAVAATQPWLLGAVIPAGMAAIGTPWIMLKVANDKWNAATMRLNEEFWSRAEPEVFVECIEKWSQIKNK